MLSIAYKNLVGSRRAACRVVAQILEEQEREGKEAEAKICQEYKKKIQKELTDICDEIINLLRDRLLPTAKDAAAKVFYYKTEGDYNRYLCEFAEGEFLTQKKEAARVAYDKATEAAKDLSVTDPIRLGLALNASVFQYEILGDSTKACSIAQNAFQAESKDSKQRVKKKRGTQE